MTASARIVLLPGGRFVITSAEWQADLVLDRSVFDRLPWPLRAAAESALTKVRSPTDLGPATLEVKKVV